MIDQFIAALNQEVDLSAEEIADTLWLAMHMEQSGVDSASRKSSDSKPDLRNIEDNSNQQTEPDLADESPTETSTIKQKSTEKEQKSDRTGVYNQQPDRTQKSLDIPFKVPDAPSLREQLDLARALRPLMRRIPSGSSLVLDEAATTQRIANEGIWLPVIKPTLEPWLDLELVVDEGISMQIWRHTIKELERLLKNYGIFRDVRVWGLISNEQNKIQIRRGIGATAKNQSPRSAAELIDSSGRRLVLVVSDCVSDLWRSGAVNLALKTWANNVPTAIIQMLPQWLWGRTALGRATEVRFQGLASSVSNRQLIANTVSLWSEIDEATGIKVPVFTLEPERVRKWAQMLVGKGSIQSTGFVFKPEVRNLEQNKPSFNLDRGELTPEQRVQAFRVTASPMARKLAGLLASAPVISLPVVRLIRETMLQDSQQVHVAEVFLGGLLKPLAKIEVDTEPDYVQYGFIDGVRELLVDSVPTSSVLNVVEEVSKFVAKKVGLSLLEFAAVLRNPEEISDSKVVEQVQPFAMVTAQVLRRLGGEYVKVADEIQSKELEREKTRQLQSQLNHEYKLKKNTTDQLKNILSNVSVQSNLTTGDITQIFKIFVNLDQIPKPQGIPHNIISSSTDKFVGRERDLENLNQQLQRNNQVVIAAVEGMAGIGKTELALQYSLLNLQLETYPGGICWIRAREQDVGLQIVNFARTCLDLNPSDDLELADRVRWCWKRWREGNTLIVLDDVKDYSDIKLYLPPQPSQFKVLVTTRLKLDLPSSLCLAVLSEPDALELLSQLVGAEKVEQELEIAKELCQRLGYLPLALQLVGRYVETRRISLAEELRRLEDRGLEHPSMKVPENYPSWTLDIRRGMKPSFDLSWDELSINAQELACYLSLFRSSTFNWFWVEHGFCDTEDKGTREELIDGEIELLDSYLLESTPDNYYCLHPLIAQHFRDKLEQNQRVEEKKRNFCQVMIEIASSIPIAPNPEDIKKVALAIPHLSNVATELIDYVNDEYLICLFVCLARFHQTQQAYDQAEYWYKKSLEICNDRLGKEHPDVNTSINNLAELYRLQKRDKEAESLFFLLN